MSRDLLLFLGDIETACQKIARYTRGRDRDSVFADEMRFDAVLHNFHVIGEAVKNLPNEFRERHPEIPWREIAGLRDFVAHAYFALDLGILWDAIENQVPALEERIRRIIEGHRRPDE